MGFSEIIDIGGFGEIYPCKPLISGGLKKIKKLLDTINSGFARRQ
jgi:hypothetical protein